jgi:hypothetical protein
MERREQPSAGPWERRTPEETERLLQQLPPERQELRRRSRESIRRLREFARTGRFSDR